MENDFRDKIKNSIARQLLNQKQTKKKNNKKLFIISGSCLALVAVIALIVVLASSKPAHVTTADTDSQVTEIDAKEITVIPPTSDKDASDTLDFKVEKISDDGTGLNLDTDFAVESDSNKKSAEKTSNVASPITPKEPKDNDNDDGGITIGGVDEAYDCGTAGHHCDGPETHAYILNLEIEGCPYCGSHSCQSFYAADEWGNTCYTPSNCPSYDIHNDPAYYCQDCGKPTGDGSNGTCVQFVEACNCPNCGQWVDAWTCHTCK
ncbi:MAG: hypothetical protein K6F76_00040 [Clostridiales bacterium]|nr:hypothetical protein [Clostridiales bacterium]